MSDTSAADLKRSFDGQKKTDGRKEESQDHSVSERIKRHAPQPELKPQGSWRARADAIDQGVRERQEARKAKNDWAKRLNESLRHGKGFNRRAR